MSRELATWQQSIEEIWEVGRRLGLDPFPTHFEIVPAEIMYEFGSYGIPGRFAHWTHGRAYHQLKTMYDYGLSKIYELVINADPCYAFLLEGNSPVQNKLVVAHVLAHSDFFKHNAYFAPTNRQMMEGASLNADRIRQYEFQHGRLEVEQFLDAVLSLQEHIDPNLTLKRPTHPQPPQAGAGGFPKKARPARQGPYDDLLSQEEREALWKPEPPKPKKVPEEPEKDILWFIVEHAADLEDWQRDIMAIVRAEMRYFIPQLQTKIINEGWASYWHARILRELDLPQDEYLEFAALHAGVLSPSKRHINPYYVGMKIFEDLERRWDHPTAEEREKFGRSGGEGRPKLFEVREMESDASFIRNYLTKQLVEDLDLYLYRLEGNEWKIVEKDWEKVRDAILSSMTNFGHPYIVVEDGDYRRNRELYLRHSYEGQELDIPWAEKALRYVYKLWGRTVQIETISEGEKILLSYDGPDNTRKRL